MGYVEAAQTYEAARKAKPQNRKKDNPTAYFANKERLEAAQAEMDASGEAYFREASRAIFTDYPELTSFTWNQYTPYFNDGERCYFRVHTDEESISVLFDSEPTEEDAGNEEWDEDESSYDRIFTWVNDPQQGYMTAVNPGHEREAEAFKRVVSLLESMHERTLLHMFGDHAEITVDRDGVDVEEYSHD